MVILTNEDGNEIRTIEYKKFDVDLNDTKDFELRIPAASYRSDMRKLCRLFVPGTEFGGLIGGLRTETAANEVTITGKSWRGVLASKIIRPSEGEDYKTVRGELNSVLATLIEEHELSALFFIPREDTEIAVSFQFNRYVTLLEGIEKMLAAAGRIISLKYVQRERGLPGHVQLSANPQRDLSRMVELSQDSRLNFIFEGVYSGVNHLICLGQGELAQRTVVDLYIQEDGSIGSRQRYFGIEEVAEIYENTSAGTIEELAEEGRKRLEELAGHNSFKMDIASLSIDAEIGDIIGGRDYITAMAAALPVVNKIYTSEGGKESIEYILSDNNRKKEEA